MYEVTQTIVTEINFIGIIKEHGYLELFAKKKEGEIWLLKIYK